jgi:peptide-methionine (S)-S-oxide reductase
MTLPLILLQLQMIAFDRSSFLDCADRQLQHRVRKNTQGDAAADHVRTNLHHFFFCRQEHDVDRELHPEAVNPLAGDDPESLAGRETLVLQQAGAACCAGIGDIGAVGQQGIFGLIRDAELQAAYCTGSLAVAARYNRGMEKATFGAGCFWGVESAFRRLAGVQSTQVGYAGGELKNPTYHDVCTDRTGHAEVVEVTYDPQVVSYHDLLEVFWNNHNPTTLNRQGPDVGTQYRSVIFYHSPEQEVEARASRDAAQSRFARPIVTQIVPAPEFWRAEEYHQQYLEKRGVDHCHI